MAEKTKNEYTVLIVDDDVDIIQIIRIYLENQGYRVLSADNGVDACIIIDREQIDLGIFDILMPCMNGYDLIKRVRKNKNWPIIVLSAKKEDVDKILGLDMGADDYLEKPFNPLELVSRVRAQLRRFYKLNSDIIPETESDVICCQELELNQKTLQLFKNGREIHVTPTELKLLMLMMKNPGRVFTKVQLYEYIHGECFDTDEKTIMVHISNLREKIEKDARQPEYLLTVRGLGYKFCNNFTKDAYDN